MEKELCEITKNILEDENNKFVLRLLQGGFKKGKPQSCENWIQIEIAKELDKRYENYSLKLEATNKKFNYDIIIEKENKAYAFIQIKINCYREGVKNDVKSLKNAKGYFLLIMTLKDVSWENRVAVQEFESMIKKRLSPLCTQKEILQLLLDV